MPTQASRSEIIDLINAYIVENSDGNITATQVNELLTLLANSFINAVDENPTLESVLTADPTTGRPIQWNNGTAIKKGTFDNSTGGAGGVSLICALGLELNFQGGRLGLWNGTNFIALNVDSLLAYGFDPTSTLTNFSLVHKAYVDNGLSAKQATLVSGTNIKTVGGVSILGSGDIPITPTIQIGTTALSLGTVGRVIFQGAGNVLQQDSNLFWDNNNKSIGFGAVPNASTRVDIRAQGALSSDIAFRIRNSVDTSNIVDVRGDGTMNFSSAVGAITFNQGSSAGVPSGIIFKNSAGEIKFTVGNSGDATIQTSGLSINSSGAAIILNGGPSGGSFYQSVDLRGNGNQSVRVNSSGQCVFTASTSWYNGDGGYSYTDRVIVDRQSMAFRNATTAPTTSLDSFKFFAKDIVAGNAAPHFLTENGSEIKLYRQSSAGIATVADVVVVLQNLGLLS